MNDWGPILMIALLSAACSDTESATAPAAADATVASPTTTENFAGVLQVGGASFYSFVVSQNGTVNVTLVSVGGTDVPSTVTLALGVGVPSGTGCGGTTPTNAQPGPDPQLTGTYAPGRYCVNVSDVGNLAAPAAFTVTIAHP